MDIEKKAKIVERFTEEFWPLNKQGNAEHAVSEVVRACTGYTFDGAEITFDLLIAKYAEYIKFMNIINNERDIKYHTRPDPIAKWIASKRYNEEFKISSSETLDKYLYGE